LIEMNDNLATGDSRSRINLDYVRVGVH
jgi:hypothetical protein